MRKTIVVGLIAAVGGFCAASIPALAALRYNIWSQHGEQFQLGYVIGYIDAVRLAQRKDPRLQIPTTGGKDFDRWVRDVNAFYADPNNHAKAVPDAMYDVGIRIREEWMQNWRAQRLKKPAIVPSPSPAP
jgi:hypothetical protein